MPHAPTRHHPHRLGRAALRRMVSRGEPGQLRRALSEAAMKSAKRRPSSVTKDLPRVQQGLRSYAAKAVRGLGKMEVFLAVAASWGLRPHLPWFAPPLTIQLVAYGRPLRSVGLQKGRPLS